MEVVEYLSGSNSFQTLDPRLFIFVLTISMGVLHLDPLEVTSLCFDLSIPSSMEAHLSCFVVNMYMWH